MELFWKKLYRSIMVSFFLTITSFQMASASTESDNRAWIHGVNFINIGNEGMLIFSSNGYKPVKPKDEWMHNIYYSWFNTEDTVNTFHPKTLVNAEWAQEPASAAVDSNGYILVTSEDAEYDQEALDQTFGIYDKNLNEVVKYGRKLMPPQGGHSGHASASGDQFLVTFCDGWIEGGGVDNLGTGDDIYSRIVYEDGTMSTLIKTEVDENSRDWWPIVAGSDTEWLQVWQKYGEAQAYGGSLWGAITSKTGQVKKFKIIDNNKYYYYDVCYVESLKVYMVTGSRIDGGFVSLIDKNGNIVASKTGLPYTVREAETIVNEVDGVVTAVYPTHPTGVAVIELTTNSIFLRKTVSENIMWDYMGTDGTFISDNDVLFATGTKSGIKFINVNID